VYWWRARYDNNLGKKVILLPSSILSSVSRGTSHLIQKGAKLVHDYTIILEELYLTAVAYQIEMKEVIPASDTESTHIDEVCRSSSLPISTVSSILALMELKGLVMQVGVINYVMAREARGEYRAKVE